MAAREPEHKLGTPQVHLPTCEKHGKLIDMNCEDCYEFVCVDCAKTDHSNRKLLTIVKADSQRRRQLCGFIKTIKEEKVPKFDRKLEQASVKMKKMERESDSEIQKLRRHYDEIIERLAEIKTRHEKSLRDNLIEKSGQVNRMKTEYVKQRKNLDKSVKLMEKEHSTMSDYDLIENHRELLKLVSAEDVDTEICEYSLIYSCRCIRDDELESLMGQIFDLENIKATETNSFQYSDKTVSVLNAFSENESYVKFFGSEYLEQINKQGDKKHKYNVFAHSIHVTDSGNIYYTDQMNKSIGRLFSTGFVSKEVSTRPLVPLGICQSLDGGLLVIFRDNDSKRYELDSRSRRLVQHMTLTGDVIREYEYQEDGQTRLFTGPLRVQQNGNSDICVVNGTSDTTGNLVILSPSGRLRSVYHGQNRTKNFTPYDVVCDPRCNILVTDFFNHRIHLLSPDGEFLKFLLTESEVHGPTVFSLCGSTLWVGNIKGIVKLFQYKY